MTLTKRLNMQRDQLQIILHLFPKIIFIIVIMKLYKPKVALPKVLGKAMTLHNYSSQYRPLGKRPLSRIEHKIYTAACSL